MTLLLKCSKCKGYFYQETFKQHSKYYTNTKKNILSVCIMFEMFSECRRAVLWRNEDGIKFK
ncbi:hypothetical protein X975_07350, partial [Stegodyphus mimosarum]